MGSTDQQKDSQCNQFFDQTCLSVYAPAYTTSKSPIEPVRVKLTLSNSSSIYHRDIY